MYNVGKFKKLVHITTESAYLLNVGPVSDSIIGAFSVSTVCMHWHQFVIKKKIDLCSKSSTFGSDKRWPT
jgi:hypothetical protein